MIIDQSGRETDLLDDCLYPHYRAKGNSASKAIRRFENEGFVVFGGGRDYLSNRLTDT